MSKAAPAPSKSEAKPANGSSNHAALAAANAARDKNIELALSSITKQFGEGSIMRLGSNAKMKVETLTTGSLAFGSGSPSLSAVPGIDLAGVEFMEAVFSLQPGQTGVAPNQSHRTLYVVRVVSQEPTDDVLKEMFLESGLSRPVQMVAQSDLMQTGREMFAGLNKEMDLVWERPPVEPEFR